MMTSAASAESPTTRATLAIVTNDHGPDKHLLEVSEQQHRQLPRRRRDGGENSKSDYERPACIDAKEEFVFDEGASSLGDTYRAMGERLAAAGDLYRASDYAGGLFLASPNPNVPPTPITKANQLVAITLDRVPIVVVRGGKLVGRRLPASHAGTMLASELFLQGFRPVDEVARTAVYLPNFALTTPGYNDGGRGRRILHIGPPASIDASADVIHRFLDVIAFATNADRTNTVAAALTCILRSHFPGAKPLILATATKSHAGKDTVIQFAAGTAPLIGASYQATDWALERTIVGALKHSPDTGVIAIDNARVCKGSFIASAFLERFLTDPEPLLFSTGTGGPTRRTNNIVLALSTNDGVVSEDLLNRSLPIHLAPVGNIADRHSPIGNPKMEFLPLNRKRIDASLMGMIERWKKEGQPRDDTVRHAYTQWAAVIGGILRVNGFTDFLANYDLRRTIDDPVRSSLGLLGATQPDTWLRPADWAQHVAAIGKVKVLIPAAERDGDEARARGLGIVLSAHIDETFSTATDDERIVVKLEKARRRLHGKPATLYRFAVLSRETLAVDAEHDGESA